MDHEQRVQSIAAGHHLVGSRDIRIIRQWAEHVEAASELWHGRHIVGGTGEGNPVSFATRFATQLRGTGRYGRDMSSRRGPERRANPNRKRRLDMRRDER